MKFFRLSSEKIGTDSKLMLVRNYDRGLIENGFYNKNPL